MTDPLYVSLCYFAAVAVVAACWRWPHLRHGSYRPDCAQCHRRALRLLGEEIQREIRR